MPVVSRRAQEALYPSDRATAAWWSALCQGEGDDEGRGGQCGCQEQIAHGG